jgi:hypothetical protein
MLISFNCTVATHWIAALTRIRGTAPSASSLESKRQRRFHERWRFCRFGRLEPIEFVPPDPGLRPFEKPFSSHAQFTEAMFILTKITQTGGLVLPVHRADFKGWIVVHFDSNSDIFRARVYSIDLAHRPIDFLNSHMLSCGMPDVIRTVFASRRRRRPKTGVKSLHAL